ncbi:MAG: NAD(P)H-dependent oxidoreductase [Phycisphaerae bacterium]|nr:NAD(P)H-dependent oxidoreductase [Phycisphaerae bacterium]
MKLLAIQGSPRANSNTRTVLDFVLEAARQSGAQTEVVHLSELKNLSGCLECHGCQSSTDEPGCVIDDDMRPVLQKALDADVIVLATPVFCWSPSWLLKIAMDRFYCLFKFSDQSVHALLEGRRMAAVVTAGGGEHDGADLVGEVCRRMAEFSKTTWLGCFLATNVVDPESIRSDESLVKQAHAFGRQLVS